MSSIHRTLTAGLSLVAVLFLAFSAGGQAPGGKDYLDEVKRKNEVLAQKMESDVRAALEAAQKLAPTNSTGAVELLKQAVARLDGDTAMTPARRESLKRVVLDRIRNIEIDAGRKPEPLPPRQPVSPATPAKTGTKTPASNPSLDEQQEVQQLLSVISQLRKERKYAEADRLAQELARNYPNNPAAQAIGRTGPASTSVGGNRTTQTDAEKRIASTLQGVEKSATPPGGDIEFSKDFQQRTAGRKTLVQLSTREKAIVRALGSPVSAPVNFNESRFEDVIEYFATVTGQPIILDKQALNDAQVGYETPISAKYPKGVTVRTMLRSLLGQFGLSYVVKDETIQVISTLKAKEMLVTRTYYLGDILEVNVFGGPPIVPAVGQAQMAQAAQQIIDTIIGSIDADSWKVNGGNGTIFFYAPTRSLIIRQSAEVHAMISGGGRW